MSEPLTNAPAAPATSADAPCMPIDPDAWHYVHNESLAVAEELNVEVQALCGFWSNLRRTGGACGQPGEARICPRCVQLYLEIPSR